MTLHPRSRPARFAGAWFDTEAVRAAYSEGAGPYRIVPSAVAVPENADDLIALVQWATETDTPLTPRGAGSGMPGGNVGSGVVVDCTRFNRPLRASAHAVVHAPAGVTIDEVNSAASRLQLRFPPNPSSASFCTIGGAVATNAAGPNAFQYGSVRPWIRGVELVTADGELGWIGRRGTERQSRRPDTGQRAAIKPMVAALERFERDVRPALSEHRQVILDATPTTTKNSSGYACREYLESGDLLDLIIGSEGTLGFVTRVEASLDALPGATGTVVLGIGRLDELPEVLDFLAGLKPSAIELLDRTFLRLTEFDAPSDLEAVLLVEFERDQPGQIRGVAGDAIRGTADACRLARIALTPEEQDALWDIRRQASNTLAQLPITTRSLQVIEDGCVPRAMLSDYIAQVRAAAVDADIEVVMFGHAGDGHLHVNTLADTTDPALRDRLAALHNAATTAVLTCGGTPSGEHGDGRLRAGASSRLYGPTVSDLFGRIKAAFDPAGILNPGVILGTPDANCIAGLKVGHDAVRIPKYIEEQLRDIERNRGWATPKHRLAR